MPRRGRTCRDARGWLWHVGPTDAFLPAVLGVATPLPADSRLWGIAPAGAPSAAIAALPVAPGVRRWLLRASPATLAEDWLARLDLDDVLARGSAEALFAKLVLLQRVCGAAGTTEHAVTVGDIARALEPDLFPHALCSAGCWRATVHHVPAALASAEAEAVKSMANGIKLQARDVALHELRTAATARPGASMRPGDELAELLLHSATREAVLRQLDWGAAVGDGEAQARLLASLASERYDVRRLTLRNCMALTTRSLDSLLRATCGSVEALELIACPTLASLPDLDELCPRLAVLQLVDCGCADTLARATHAQPRVSLSEFTVRTLSAGLLATIDGPATTAGAAASDGVGAGGSGKVDMPTSLALPQLRSLTLVGARLQRIRFASNGCSRLQRLVLCRTGVVRLTIPGQPTVLALCGNAALAAVRLASEQTPELVLMNPPPQCAPWPPQSEPEAQSQAQTPQAQAQAQPLLVECFRLQEAAERANASRDFATCAALCAREATFRTALAGRDCPLTLSALHREAFALAGLGDSRAAAALGCEVLHRRKRVLGPLNAETLKTEHNLAGALAASGEWRRADDTYAAVVAARAACLGSRAVPTRLSRAKRALARLNGGGGGGGEGAANASVDAWRGEAVRELLLVAAEPCDGDAAAEAIAAVAQSELQALWTRALQSSLQGAATAGAVVGVAELSACHDAACALLGSAAVGAALRLHRVLCIALLACGQAGRAVEVGLRLVAAEAQAAAAEPGDDQAICAADDAAAAADSAARYTDPSAPRTSLVRARQLVARALLQAGRPVDADAWLRATLALCTEALPPAHPLALQARADLIESLLAARSLRAADTELAALAEVLVARYGGSDERVACVQAKRAALARWREAQAAEREALGAQRLESPMAADLRTD